MAQVVKPGTRVKVTSGDGKTDLGYGTYEGNAPTPEDARKAWQNYQQQPGVLAEGQKPVSFDTAPLIKLDSGETLWGYECWWMPA